MAAQTSVGLGKSGTLCSLGARPALPDSARFKRNRWGRPVQVRAPARLHLYVMAGLTRRDFLAGSTAMVGASCGREDSAAPVPPNILLVVPDQLRPDWTGLNPDIGVRTPHLNALAARGVNFENCYCASPLCAPSRACLAGGREYDRCGVPDNSLNYPLDQVTYYTLLRQAGYHV